MFFKVLDAALANIVNIKLLYLALVSEIFLIIAFTWTILYAIKNLRYKLYIKTQLQHPNQPLYFIQLLKVSYSPIQLVLWTLALYAIFEIIYKHSHIYILYINKLPVCKTIIILSISWLLIRWIKVIEKKLLLESKKYSNKAYKTTINTRIKIFQAIILIISSLILLDNFGIKPKTLVALGGLSSIIVSFASKDLLANFFGTLMIYLDQSFEIDDKIKILDYDIEGKVEKINWRSTEIITYDKKLLYVPNHIFANAAIQNASKTSHYLIQEKFKVHYKDYNKLIAILHDIKNVIINNSNIDRSQNIIVNANSLFQDSLILLINCFTYKQNNLSYNLIKQDVIVKIIDILEQKDIKLKI